MRIKNYSNHHEADTLTYFYHILLHVGEVFLTCWGFFSLTERTEFTEVFGVQFEHTEGLRHTENTEASPPSPSPNGEGSSM